MVMSELRKQELEYPIKTKYKFIYFVEWVNGDWAIHNKKSHDIIGKIEFYRPWKQWVFSASPGAVFNDSCLKDIIYFIGQLK